MPFREKAKALFKTRSRHDSLSQTSTNDSDRSRQASNVYKPGEPMPRPKYRAPPKKEHKEKLEAFSFAEAWRRKSFQSQYSPMGTRAPSRRASFLSIARRKSSAGKSVGQKSSASRKNSVASGDAEKSGTRHREGLGAAVATRLSTEAEADGDDDVANVGLSRVQSRDKPAISRPRTADREAAPDGGFKTITTAHDHQPFTEHDLALALQRSHLAVPTQS